MKRRWLTALLLAGALALALPCAAGFAQQLRLDLFDMGKADAMLVTLADGYTLLIDAGTNKGGKALVERFEQAGLGPIDMMIVTHYDKDHVGGADKIIEDVGVGTVVMPVYHKESKQYDQFIEALDEHPDVSRVALGAAQQTAFERCGATVTISAAHREDYGEDEENDFSLAVRIRYGETSFLFAGDAEEPRQLELLAEGDVQCDVLKVPYHGRLTDTSEAFLSAARPQIALITDSDEEPASEVVLALLGALGAKTYCTKDGGVSVLSDGSAVWVEGES